MAGVATQTHAERQAVQEKEGKYLTFALAHEGSTSGMDRAGA